MSDKIKMLIVDNEPLLCKGIQLFFQRRGFDCHIANSEKEVSHLINYGYLPEVALIDLHLNASFDFVDNQSFGSTEGFRLAEIIQEATDHRCRLVVMSAYEITDLRESITSSGVWGYIGKPIRQGHQKLAELLQQGLLSPEEMHQPVIDLDNLFSKKRDENDNNGENFHTEPHKERR